MNLFKKYYPVAKRELKNYRENASPAGTAEEKLNKLKWNVLISKYIELCDDEQKKFIDLLYFKNHPILEVGLIFPLGLRTCQEWREKTLKNILLLAAGEGLLPA